MAVLDTLLITAPIYLIIGLGFGAVRFGLFQKTDMRLMGRLLVLIILPVMVFRTISRYDIAEILQWDYLAVYALASLLAWGLAHQWAYRLRGHSGATTAFVGMGVACSNSVFVGYPILSPLVGPVADVALALCLLVVGMLGISEIQNELRARELAQVDLALLLDDLPPAAFSDPGFIQFLKSEER